MTAVMALTERHVRSGFRSLDMVFAVLAPVLMLGGLTFALRGVIDTGGMDYAQYVLPAVVVQAMLFGALNTTDIAASEHSSNFGDRLRTLPISSYTPLLARMTYCLVRGILAVAAALVAAHLFGFRMDGGLGSSVAFVMMSLTLTIALSLGADAAGARAKRTDTSSQLLLVPQLLLILLSTGLAPAESFPGWIQPFVLYQPISVITDTLRGFSSGHVQAANLAASVAWCVGLLLVLGAVAMRGQRRER